jgi:hypothetical protein
MSDIEITPAVFQATDGEYNKEYEVTLVLSWVSNDGYFVSANKTVVFSFVDYQAPEFSILMQDSSMLASAEDEQVIDLDITNIREDLLNNYTVEWTVIPDISDGVETNDSYTIPAGSLVFDQIYVLTVKMYHTEHPSLQNLVSQVFFTKAAPSGGVVSILPESAAFGD